MEFYDDPIAESSHPLSTAAQGYADRGYAVFPCLPGTKRPAIKWGAETVACAETTERRWRHHPTLNIGISCGPSRLVVIDVDTKGGINGWKALDECLERLGELSGTAPRVMTPTGGAHLYFRAPEGVEIRNSAGKLGPGLDVRAVGGFVVAPPSVIEGRAYHWTDMGEPPVLPRAWADAMVNKPKPAPAPIPFRASGTGSPERLRVYCISALEAESGILAATPRGQRNETLHRFACRLGGLVPSGGLTEREIEEAARWACAQWPTDERDQHKDLRTLQRGVRWGTEHPRELRLL